MNIADQMNAECGMRNARSEEHTSELQSQSNLVCRLLLEKKKQPRSHGLAHWGPARERRSASTRFGAVPDRRITYAPAPPPRPCRCTRTAPEPRVSASAII